MQGNYTIPRHIKATYASRTEELHRVRQLIEDEALGFGFDKETAFRLALAVDEACTNIIKHSYEGNPGNTFDVELRIDEESFQILLTDQGKQFDPGARPHLDMRAYFDRMSRGGLGIHIMKLVMDDVAYDFTLGHANQLKMVKYRG